MEADVFMSTSVGGGRGGGEEGVCACWTWLGECGGLEKVGEVGCWKCSGCSTLTLMVRMRDLAHV